MNRGRKTILDQSIVDLADEYFKYGRLTGYTSLALAIHCHPNTVQRWVREGFALMTKPKKERTESEQLRVELAEKAKIPDSLLKAAHKAINDNLTGPPQFVDLTTARYVIDRHDQQMIAVLATTPVEEFRSEDHETEDHEE